MTEEVDVRLVSGMSKKTSVAKFDWGNSTAECVVLIEKEQVEIAVL